MNKKLVLLLGSLIGLNLTTHSMNRAVSGAQRLNNAIRKTIIYGHYALAGIAASIVCENISSNPDFTSDTKQLSRDETQWAHKILSNQKYPLSPVEVLISKEELRGYVRKDGTIVLVTDHPLKTYIEATEPGLLIKLFSTSNYYNRQKKLYQDKLALQAILAHEAAHIYHNHSQKLLYSLGLAPWITLALFEGGGKLTTTLYDKILLRKLFMQKSHWRFMVESARIGLKISSALLRILGTCSIILGTRLAYEYQADTEMLLRIKDANILSAGIELFKSITQRQKDRKSALDLVSRHPFLTQYPQLLEFALDPFHPPLSTRIKRLEKRVEELQKTIPRTTAMTTNKPTQVMIIGKK